MGNFTHIPPLGTMKRKDRMKRLLEKLISDGLYVHPVGLDETVSEWGYFIVSVDDPYEAASRQGQDHG